MTLSWEIISNDLITFFRKPVLSRGEFTKKVSAYYNIPKQETKMLRNNLVMSGRISLKGERIYIND